ncbi:MAG: hypothetical protein IPH35_15880 [Rhodoferax sp.]|nr:hypothetical protein [Rhodoferax sp.]
MFANTLSIAPAALRSPYAAAAARVQPIRPVVAREPSNESFAPRERQAARAQGTSYTPGAKGSTGDGLYLRNGKLPHASNSNGANAYQAAFSVDRQDSLELQIKTADGDIATISLAQSQSSSATVQATSSKKGATLTLDTKDSSSLNVQMAVRGELDAEETQSINALVQQISSVAQDFFAGDMQQAMDAATHIDIGQQSSGELSAFSVDLRSTEVRRAVTAYQGVADVWTPPPKDSTPAPTPAPAPENVLVQSPPAAGVGDTFMQRMQALLDQFMPSFQDMIQPKDASVASELTQEVAQDMQQIPA